MPFQPVIKWSGSKRHIAYDIIKYFPKRIDTYYEPFVGGGSVVRALLESDINVNRYICSDVNSDLINLWNMIKENPKLIANAYAKMWHELNSLVDYESKKAYFLSVRERFNKERSPFDFMFIMRTCFNGMPRYNKKGEFNNTFHITRNGINPGKLESILNDWSFLLNKYNVEFICCDYQNISPNKEDFIYLDPPYSNTKGMYYGSIDYAAFFDWLKGLNCNYIFSFDGKHGDCDNTFNVPKEVYSTHYYLFSGNSSLFRLIGKSNNCLVYESLYIK